MLHREQLDHVCVVLVRARNPNNIGAVARAMYDFGFHDLRLVNEYQVPLAEARSAIDATKVLAGAKEFASLGEAIADCNLVIGTTAGGKRVQEHPLYTVAEGCDKARSHLGDAANCVAILFGSEKTGLSREELSYCHWTMTIPMANREAARHPSMNLGQAAAVCLYELAQREGTAVIPEGQPAPSDELDRVTGLLSELLELSEYPRRHPANKDEATLRRLVRRMQFTKADAAMWMGIVRQALWKIDQKER